MLIIQIVLFPLALVLYHAICFGTIDGWDVPFQVAKVLDVKFLSKCINEMKTFA